MLFQFRNYRFYLVMAAEIVIFAVSFLGAYLLRFDFTLTPFYHTQILGLLPLILPIKILIFFFFGMYRGLWRYVGLNDLWRLFQASFLSMLCCISIAQFIHSYGYTPRSIFFVDAMLTFLISGALRITLRIFKNNQGYLWIFSLPSLFSNRIERKSVLIVGAGDAGEKMYREILDNPSLNYNVVGFLDDDRDKRGRSLHGVKVYGGVERLPEVVKRVNIDEVLIALPSATGGQIRRIIGICKNCRANYRILPEIGAIINGKVSIKILRDVKYEDLLRRTPVRLNTAEISQYLGDKRVLVTGAGGSIGSELCRQIVRFEPEELVLVDFCEANLYNIQMELQHELNFTRHRCILGRVQDQNLMEDVLSGYRPQLIFHTAAYKHVPMLEKNPWRAISSNIRGSRVVMELALKYGVERFVLVSTDKAVRPTNVMGASKRLAELMVQSLQGNGTRFMAVRFGNVIGSSGSVLPLFRRQLECGGPITVTHPDVTRYFMTIPEAAQLILQAGSLGEGGEIFILEMGTPVKIAKMAEELVRLSGKEPGKDVEIIYTGLRDGEKLYEELITQGENVVNTRHQNILVLRSNGWNGNKTQKEFITWLDKSLAELYRIADTHDAYAIRSKLAEILPEYTPQHMVKCALPWKCSACNVKGPANLMKDQYKADLRQQVGYKNKF